MKELITEVTSSSISYPKPTTTDEVAFQYENKLNQMISVKILVSQSTGQPANFTKEELAYLNRKASEEGPYDEIKVITPDPTITLKKGKTEINIKNAATLVKKMEEIYPSPNKKTDEIYSLLNRKVESGTVTAGELDEIIDELENDTELTTELPKKSSGSFRDELKKRVDFPTQRVSPEVAKCVAPDEDTFSKTYRPADVKTVNKNAYELRTDILEMALEWVKFKKEVTNQLSSLSDDDVLSAAQKFYRFVENRR